VDFHGNFDNLLNCVVEFVRKIPADGTLVYCEEDAGAREVASRFDGSKFGYGFRPLDLTLAGRHQNLNAVAALKVAEVVGANRDLALKGAAEFRGADRRLQVLRSADVAIVDDYAHHPTEVVASIEALRQQFPGRRLIVVFQPHLYSRTVGLIREFAAALNLADYVFLT